MSRRTGMVFILLVVIGFIIYLNQTVLTFSPQLLKDWFVSFGIFAPVIFILAYTARPFILFPASVLSITSGLLFGAVAGTIYTVIGATFGAVLSFLLAKTLGKGFAGNKRTDKMDKVQKKIEQNGFLSVLFLRLVPLFNFDLISYLSGLTRIKLYSFFLATFVGIIPGTFAYNILGSSLDSGSWQQISIAAFIFCLIIGLSIFLKRKIVIK